MNRTLFALATSVLLAGALGVSCGDNEPDDSNPGASGGNNPGTGGVGQGGDGSVCHPSQTLCDDFCASTASDRENCGACGAECRVGEGCMDGSCQGFGPECTTGQVMCDEACTNLQADREHCGACGSSCDSGEVCDNGLCATSCSDDRIDCGGGCIDPLTDRLYCGAESCDTAAGGASGGEACADGEVCADGLCTSSCSGTQVVCDNRCIDPSSNDDFCGATDCSDESTNGEACTSEQSCTIGQCRTFVFEWSEGVPISEDGEAAGNGQVLGTDALGNTLVAFKQFGVAGDESTVRLYSRRYLFETKAWTPVIRVDVGIEKQARNQVLAVNEAGQAYVVWDTTNEIYGAAYDSSSNTWTAPIRLDDGVANIVRETPTVAIDGAGNAWVAWSQGTTGTTFRIARSYYQRSTHSHTVPEVLTGYGEIDDYKSYYPVLKMNEESDVALVWSEQDLTDGIDSRLRVMGAVKDSAGSWTAPALLSGGPRITPWLGPADLGIDDVGNAYVVWTNTEKPEDWPNYDADVVMLKITGGVAGPIVPIETESKILRKPRISTDASGKSVVAYYGGDYSYFNDPLWPDGDDVDGPWEVYATQVDSTLTDTTTTLLVTIPDPTPADAAPDKDNIDPSVVLDGLGNSHVTWTQGSRVDTSAFNVGVGSWSAPENLVPADTGGGSVSAAMSAAPGGRAFATWYQAGTVIFARYD